MADSPAAEYALDESGVRSLLREQAPELAGRPLVRSAEGWDNVTWRLGTDLAVRLPRRVRSAGLIRHEQQALPRVAPALAAVGVRTPVPLVHGRPTDDFPWPWSIIPWIRGSQALGRAVEDNAVWAPVLAQALRALHQEAPADAPENPVRGIPLVRRDAGIQRRLERRPGAISSALAQLWQTGLAAPASDERVWIHGDLHPGNLLVDDARLTAIIDFGDITAGDPAYDLAVAWEAFDSKGRAVLRDELGDRYDAATWVRARAWAAAIAVILLDESDDRDDYRALGAIIAAELLSEESAPHAL